MFRDEMRNAGSFPRDGQEHLSVICPVIFPFFLFFSLSFNGVVSLVLLSSRHTAPR